MNQSLVKRLVAEAVGTSFLLAAVVGSGIMGERLAGGNVAIALLANTLATGAALAALIRGLCSNLGSSLQPGRNAHGCLAEGDRVARESIVCSSPGRGSTRRSSLCQHHVWVAGVLRFAPCTRRICSAF